MLEELRKQVYLANMELPARGLVTYTWGNVSGIDRKSGYIVIKPSGVSYDRLSPECLVILDLDGNRIEGELNPSSDTATHLQLYRAFPSLGGIVHTQSLCRCVGASRTRYSLLWNNSCRLFLWAYSMCPLFDTGGD